MYLKNDSKFQVGLKTTKGTLTINPGDTVHVFDSDIAYLSDKLTQITETEYNQLTEKTKNNESKDDTQTKKEDVEKTDKKEQEEQPEDKTGETNNDVKGNEVTTPEDKKEEDKKEEDKKEKSELELLTDQLEALKQKWIDTTAPVKKEKIQKKIKAIQEQIAKLK